MHTDVDGWVEAVRVALIISVLIVSIFPSKKGDEGVF